MDPGRVLWIVFTDMDGTLLDQETYRPGPSLRALERCLERGVPVVLNSSKTRAEMEPFHRRLPLLAGAPFVSENGGGVFLPAASWERPRASERCGDFWRVSLGAPHREVLAALRRALNAAGLCAELFSDLPPEEIASRTGLPLEEARLAARREFDEPFWLRAGSAPAALDSLRGAMNDQGLEITRGGRLFHAHGLSDKGRAVRFVGEAYRQVSAVPVRSAGVGDAANDLPLLEAVDRPYLVRRSDGAYDPEIPEGKGIRRVPGIGPEGFAQAVEDLLAGTGPRDG